ncbi:MAG: hypothetical protein AB1744_14395, partial [Candidatus Zixiibacteriota bacterium]
MSISSNARLSHVVVKFRDDSGVRLRNGNLISIYGSDLQGARTVLQPYVGASMRRLFQTVPETKLDRDRDTWQLVSRRQLADLNGYYHINVTSPAEAERLVNELNAVDIVEIAYAEPMPEPAGDIDPPTPDYQSFQDYR